MAPPNTKIKERSRPLPSLHGMHVVKADEPHHASPPQDLAACDEDSGLDPALLNRSAEGWHKAKARAYAAADVLMRSDAPLLFAPGKLALAALRAAFRKVRQGWRGCSTGSLVNKNQ